MRKLLITLYIIVLILIILWVYFAPGWASVVTLAMFIITLIAFFVKNSSLDEQKEVLKEKLNNQSLILLTKLIKKIDTNVLVKTRKLNTEKYRPVELFDKYLSFLKKFSKRKQVKIEYILEFLNQNKFKPIISNEVDFIVNVEENLNLIELQSHNSATVFIKKPKLMWECSCNGNIKKNYKNCPIHKHFKSYKEAKKFSKNFSNGLVKIKYGDIELFWKNEKDLWPPSIDSFNLITDLKINGYNKKPITSILDIGSGTGFLGIWFAKNNPQVKQVHFSDWLLLPLFFSYTNSKHNIPYLDTQFLLGLNTSWFPLDYSKRVNEYDLVICNPPYLPELGFKELTKESTVAGTQLMKSVIKNGLDIGREVIISFSELVLPEALLAAEENGIDLNQYKIGGPHTVPFRVPIALKRKEYINKLKNERALIEDSDSEFRYWHNINTYSLKRLPTKNIVHLADNTKYEDDSN